MSKLEGSATKYQHLPKDDESSDSDTEGDKSEKAIKPLVIRGVAEEAVGDKKPTYVDLDFVGATAGAGKPPAQRPRQSAARRNYVKIDQSSGAPPPPPPPPPPSHTPQIVVQAASVSGPLRKRMFSCNHNHNIM